MPNTGQFYLHEVIGQTDERDRLLQITRVECRCLACCHNLSARLNDGLIDLQRGAVLICPTCGNRQAISIARFDCFLERIRKRL
ncbi:hypothetical protein ACIPR8_19345 [Stenotrophomonas sp. LARHCG68]